MEGFDIMLEKVFKLRENHTTVKTEVLAGITTFMTMAYILAVNPSVLGAWIEELYLPRPYLLHFWERHAWHCLQTIRLLLHQVWDLMHILHIQ